MKPFSERLRDTSKRATGLVRQAYRAVLRGINAGTPIQLIQADALQGEQLQAAELFQQFGFTSSPPEGTQLIILPLGGQTAHSIIVSTEHGSYRIAVQRGEVCVYNQWGAYIKLLKERIIEIDCDELNIRAKDKIAMETTDYQVRASAQVAYNTPAYVLGGDGARAKAVMSADIEQDGYHQSSGDQVAGTISQIHHRHKDSGGSGTGGEPVG